MEPILEIKDLHAGFETQEGYLPALRGVTLDVFPGEIIAIVGESGCGKTLTALSILNLLDPPAAIKTGEITFKGTNLLKLSENALNSIRGKDISMIFQEPMVSLNPVFSIGTQIAEVFTTHTNISKKEAMIKAVDLLKQVQIPDPEQRVHNYPFELSGGMRQRAMIAMSLALSPSLLIADEPTTALDVTIQGQILKLIKDMSRQNNTSVILISHDLGLVSQFATRTLIMYAGEIVESGPTARVLELHKHPYTEGLLNSLPSGIRGEEKQRLNPIPGTVPSLKSLPGGCVFRNRCPYQKPECYDEIPDKQDKNHLYRCVR